MPPPTVIVSPEAGRGRFAEARTSSLPGKGEAGALDGPPSRPLVIGAGPAGLTAALELVRFGVAPLVVEKGLLMGGLARTEERKGYRFDIGGHRFYTKVAEVEDLWGEMLGAEFRRTRRLSRIFYRNRFFKYPLEPLDALAGLGPVESLRIGLSYMAERLRRRPEPQNFQEWVVRAFGRRLFEVFFETYTEKVWGLKCTEISAEWAAQRIRKLSLAGAVVDALRGGGGEGSLIREFGYPRLGPGMMWERFAEVVAGAGGRIVTGVEVTELRRKGDRIEEVVGLREGREVTYETDHVISTMALRDLIARIRPAPPEDVTRAAADLKYRAFIIVVLVIRDPSLFPDNWIYIHEPGLRVGRIQNFKNWSEDLVPDADTTSVGLEYFCTEGDDLWESGDEALVELARDELERLGLAGSAAVEEGFVIRQPDAYPVYDPAYRENLATIRGFLDTIENLDTIGRNGMHRYNNQDHSMVTGLLAVRNLYGESHDLWSVNMERSFYETFQVPR
ncbi:MAG TPA: NAD(P)/FAD-dependent oxidoreductase [Longimicrobiales bacterium]